MCIRNGGGMSPEFLCQASMRHKTDWINMGSINDICYCSQYLVGACILVFGYPKAMRAPSSVLIQWAVIHFRY